MRLLQGCLTLLFCFIVPTMSQRANCYPDNRYLLPNLFECVQAINQLGQHGLDTTGWPTLYAGHSCTISARTGETMRRLPVLHWENIRDAAHQLLQHCFVTHGQPNTWGSLALYGLQWNLAYRHSHGSRILLIEIISPGRVQSPSLSPSSLLALSSSLYPENQDTIGRPNGVRPHRPHRNPPPAPASPSMLSLENQEGVQPHRPYRNPPPPPAGPRLQAANQYTTTSMTTTTSLSAYPSSSSMRCSSSIRSNLANQVDL
jgi:hypothetical protein